MMANEKDWQIKHHIWRFQESMDSLIAIWTVSNSLDRWKRHENERKVKVVVRPCHRCRRRPLKRIKTHTFGSCKYSNNLIISESKQFLHQFSFTHVRSFYDDVIKFTFKFRRPRNHLECVQQVTQSKGSKLSQFELKYNSINIPQIIIYYELWNYNTKLHLCGDDTSCGDYWLMMTPLKTDTDILYFREYSENRLLENFSAFAVRAKESERASVFFDSLWWTVANKIKLRNSHLFPLPHISWC